MTSQIAQLRPRHRRGVTVGDVLARLTGAQLAPGFASGDDVVQAQIDGLAIGSRDVREGDMFIALTGLRSHGAHFAADALSRGAYAILTDHAGVAVLNNVLDADQRAQTPVVVWDGIDDRTSIGLLSQWFYGDPSAALTVVGVTGTNGKTTTTYFVDAALRAHVGDQATALVGTIELAVAGQHISSPRTTLEAPALQGILALAREEGAQAATVEISSHAIALRRIAGLHVDVAVFTNLQRDHLDFHKDMEGYFEAKAQLFTPEYSQRGVVCVDDPWGARLAATAPIPIDAVATLPDAAAGAHAGWRVADARISDDNVGSTFRLLGPDGIDIRAHSPLPGVVNVSNAAVAIVAAYRAGVPLEVAVRGIEAITQVPGRMQRVLERSATSPLVIVDYAHTPDALVLALEAVRHITPGKVCLVFSSDGDRDQGKRPQMGVIAGRLADVIYVTDENPRSEKPAAIRAQILAGVREERPDMRGVHEVSPRWEAVRQAIAASGPQDTVIITGKGHEPHQEIADGVRLVYNDVEAVERSMREDPWDGGHWPAVYQPS